jgi:hypothetical protein
MSQSSYGPDRHARFPLTFSADRWDRSKGLRQTVTVTFVVSSIGAIGNWYNWAHGAVSFYFPLALTVVAAATVALTPRKLDLFRLSAGGLLGLEIFGFALHGAPLHLWLEWVPATAAVAILLQCMNTKAENPMRDARTHHQSNCRPEDSDRQ